MPAWRQDAGVASVADAAVTEAAMAAPSGLRQVQQLGGKPAERHGLAQEVGQPYAPVFAMGAVDEDNYDGFSLITVALRFARLGAIAGGASHRPRDSLHHPPHPPIPPCVGIEEAKKACLHSDGLQ